MAFYVTGTMDYTNSTPPGYYVSGRHVVRYYADIRYGNNEYWVVELGSETDWIWVRTADPNPPTGLSLAGEWQCATEMGREYTALVNGGGNSISCVCRSAYSDLDGMMGTGGRIIGDKVYMSFDGGQSENVGTIRSIQGATHSLEIKWRSGSVWQR